MKNQLVRLTHYNLWANKKVCEHFTSLSEEQLDKEIISSFPSVKKTVYHVWGAQQIWLLRLRGTSPTVAPNKDFNESLTEGTEAFHKTSEELIRYMESADDALLQTVLSYRTLDGTEYTSKIFDIIQHVVNHSTYHRGQLINMLRQLGFTKISSTDFIAWTRL